MKLIPVIDVRDGCVVRAVRGDRARYRPIVSSLCAGHQPVEVARALLSCTGSDLLYLADLDALTGGAPQSAVVERLLTELPGVELWLDAGYRQAEDWRLIQAALGASADRVRPVFASEALASAARAAEALQGAAGSILSLDTRGGQALDPAGCWEAPELWPDDLIVMTLDRVGSGEGPDLDTLAQVRARRPGLRVIGAGGIRSDADMDRAAASGAWAWLVASALHDRGISAVGHGSSLF
ncbi:MAG: nickel transporter [Rhodocyclaceae bacterium]|nr:nickel transporter [Rhodocyclaceae bacterium]